MSKKIFTSWDEALRMGATHWIQMGQLAVLLREEIDQCDDCGEDATLVFQPINQDGGPGPICPSCIEKFLGVAPRPLPCPLPTHVVE